MKTREEREAERDGEKRRALGPLSLFFFPHLCNIEIHNGEEKRQKKVSVSVINWSELKKKGKQPDKQGLAVWLSCESISPFASLWQTKRSTLKRKRGEEKGKEMGR